MAEFITHPFVSAKSDSPDSTLVSANEWNDGHILSGGINGQILVYDSTQPNNMKWIDGGKSLSNTYTAGAVGSPFTTPIFATLNSSSNIIAQINPDLYCFTSGGTIYSFALSVNGAPIFFIGSILSATRSIFPLSTSFTPGAYNFTATVTASGGTFISIEIVLRILSLGIL